MNYQVLARKWRPKKFEEIVGQQYVVTALTNSFNLKKIHHSYILSGSRGTGKTTIARLFAKSLNCKEVSIVSICGICQNCKDIDSGCFSDLIEIDAASRTKVEDTYEFLDTVQYAPVQGKFKIYILDEVHMLSKHSFNALLKTLEEPPEHVKFILITTESQKIPETILSRCLQFHLKPLSVSHILLKLTHICKEEKIIINENSLELLAYAAKGSMRDALNLLEQAILLGDNSITDDIIKNMLGLLHVEESLSLVENLVHRNIDNVMNQINNYAIVGINWDCLFEEILIIFQKAAMYQFSLTSSLKNTDERKIKHLEERILNLSNNLTPEDIQLYYQIFLLGRKELPYSPSDRMGTEMTILRALAFSPINICSNNNTNTQLSNDNTNISYEHSDKIQQNISNTQNNITNTADNTLVLNHINNDIDLKKTMDHFKCFNKNNDSLSSIPSDIIKTNNVTSKILEVRSKLLNYKNDCKKSNTNIVDKDIHKTSQKISKNVLERFSNINVNIVDNNRNNTKKKQ